MQALDLIKTAQELAAANGKKPRQSNLLRATSTAYYALFHTLAKTCADTIIGGAGADRSDPAWSQVYRSLDHGPAKTACENGAVMALFPTAIQDFANHFRTMQLKRHKADYDPDERLSKSAVLIDIKLAAEVIQKFNKEKIRDRRAFAAHVLFKRRP